MSFSVDVYFDGELIGTHYPFETGSVPVVTVPKGEIESSGYCVTQDKKTGKVSVKQNKGGEK